jgi:hypothetical protein
MNKYVFPKQKFDPLKSFGARLQSRRRQVRPPAPS